MDRNILYNYYVSTIENYDMMILMNIHDLFLTYIHIEKYFIYYSVD